MKVKCKRCGMEYVLPDGVVSVGGVPVMEDCPVCKGLDAQMKAMGLS